MDTWSLLVKELNYHGIRLLDSKKCQVYDDATSGLNAIPKTQGVIRTLREVNHIAKQQKKLFLFDKNILFHILLPATMKSKMTTQML